MTGGPPEEPGAGADAIRRHFGEEPPARLGVAVSGGGDSVALLILLAEWAGQGGPRPFAVTVDHGLRPESAAEAAGVATLCADLGISHDILRWQGWDGTGNLPDAARRARYALMADWARERAIADIALGHTADDQAETLLMRLARGAGVDGLSAMRPRRDWHGIRLHRPVLGVTRAALRDVLRRRGIGWAEDPTNEDARYERVRARQVLAALAPLGLDAPGLAGVAARLGEARQALETCTARLADSLVTFDAGDILIRREALGAEPPELARRLMQAALLWVGGGGYPPRGDALSRVLRAAVAGRDATLQGCRVLPCGENLRVTREWKAVADMRVPAGQVWDGRWRLEGPGGAGFEIAALGEAGLPHCPGRRATGRPAAALVASPAVWRGAVLIAAPLAGLENGWSARLIRGEAAFRAAILSH